MKVIKYLYFTNQKVENNQNIPSFAGEPTHNKLLNV